MTLLLSRPEYEQWLYAVPVAYPTVRTSTLRFFTTSATTAAVAGAVEFYSGHVLIVSELVDFAAGEILDYGYEVWQAGTKLYWYDPQPHPQDPLLAQTLPHHKHIPPDIKHHRIPAAELRFDQPNLPFLIQEIVRYSEAP
jgi:hypothetical protein